MVHHLHAVRRLALAGWFLHPVQNLDVPIGPYVKLRLERGTVLPERGHPHRFASPWPALIDGTVLLRIVIPF